MALTLIWKTKLRKKYHQSEMAGGIFIPIFIVARSQRKIARRYSLGVIFSPFLVSQAVKKETSPTRLGQAAENLKG